MTKIKRVKQMSAEQQNALVLVILIIRKSHQQLRPLWSFPEIREVPEYNYFNVN